MENFYLVILAFLALLACFDLFVGVSNDASNFLNSALGCRISSYRTTMIVASVGVLLGATFSSGMMEIARSGVFHPQMFSFAEIMVIFFAVMVSDVLLLDTFNSLGLPTSTTVSIVFELLGSAMAAAMYKLWVAEASLAEVVDFINTSKALTIITGILVSVVVAFIAGSVVQYLVRLVFTFHFERMYRRLGGIFGGISITAIFYFLIMKGAAGASFMRPEWLAWINGNTDTILLTMLHPRLQPQRFPHHHFVGHVLTGVCLCRKRLGELRRRPLGRPGQRHGLHGSRFRTRRLYDEFAVG